MEVAHYMKNTNTGMTKNQQLKLIRDAYDRLYCLNNITWTKYRDNLYREHLEGERQHDRMRPEGTDRGITLSDAAKLFVVHWIAEYLFGKKAPDVASYINMRKEAFTSYSLVANYRKEIEAAWKDINVQALAGLDYAKLMEKHTPHKRGKGKVMNKLPKGITIHKNSFDEYVAVENGNVAQVNGKNVSASRYYDKAVEYYLTGETNKKAYLGD